MATGIGVGTLVANFAAGENDEECDVGVVTSVAGSECVVSWTAAGESYSELIDTLRVISAEEYDAFLVMP